jgi:hypothetical protein
VLAGEDNQGGGTIPGTRRLTDHLDPTTLTLTRFFQEKREEPGGAVESLQLNCTVASCPLRPIIFFCFRRPLMGPWLCAIFKGFSKEVIADGQHTK